MLIYLSGGGEKAEFSALCAYIEVTIRPRFGSTNIMSGAIKSEAAGVRADSLTPLPAYLTIEFVPKFSISVVKE